uniref:CSON010206 protein n=1 Tax=Culicoides sonorensis TaxID=179676 RepID=A0A336KIJ7_CULSO
MSSSSDWSREAINALIQSYKEQPLLYDTKLSPLYYNKKARQTSIEKILAEVLPYRPETTAHDIIKKIQVLRTQYGQEVTKIKKSQKFGEEFAYQPKIWWFTELDFLKKFMKQRPNPPPVKKNERSSEEEEEEETYTVNTEKARKRIRVSEENITIVDQHGTPLTETSPSQSNKSNKYLIYQDDSYVDGNDPHHQSEIIVEPYTKPIQPKRNEEVGKFVASQMAAIKDDILFYKTQQEILTIINKAIIKQLEKNATGGILLESE